MGRGVVDSQERENVPFFGDAGSGVMLSFRLTADI